MNAKKLSFLLLILVAVACTNRSTSSEQDEMRHWNNVLQQINALLLENKARQTLDLAKQTLPEILESAEKNGTTDTLIYYARKIFNACGNNYINTKQYKDGIDYMDSIGNHPLIREHCPHELLSFKAGLNQLYGNNPEAVRLAEDYLQLPVCTSANDFIRQAEIISGVYMYSGNNLPKAIQILEKAIDVYRKGGNFPNMLRIMSRLGIYYHLSGEYEKAIATNQEAIATYNDSIAPGNVVIAYGEQANLYAELGMYDQALEMNKKAQYYSMLKDSFGLGDLYRYRAQIFRNMNQKDSVFHYLRLGEKLSMIQNSFKGVFVNKVETVNSYLDYPDSLEKAASRRQSRAGACGTGNPDSFHTVRRVRRRTGPSNSAGGSNGRNGPSSARRGTSPRARQTSEDFFRGFRSPSGTGADSRGFPNSRSPADGKSCGSRNPANTGNASAIKTARPLPLSARPAYFPAQMPPRSPVPPDIRSGGDASALESGSIPRDCSAAPAPRRRIRPAPCGSGEVPA